MMIHHVIQLIFVLVGLLTLLAAVFNCDWLFTANNAQLIVNNIGRRRARLFYAAVGILMIGAGVCFHLSM